MKYLVVGRGLVGRMFGEDDRFDLISHDDFRKSHEIDLVDYDGFICAAAVSSNATCNDVSWREVVRGNVQLPVDLLHVAEIPGKSVILLSSSGVYKTPGVAKETDDVEPHNRYTASKLMMEYAIQCACYERSYIFRLPFICTFTDYYLDMPGRVQRWTKCENVKASIVYREQLMDATLNALNGHAVGGIYNIMSENIRLPEFINRKFDWQGEVVEQGSLGLTPSTCLDISKAKARGIL